MRALLFKPQKITHINNHLSLFYLPTEQQTTITMRALLFKPQKITHINNHLSLNFGPFNSSTQRRWKKPANTAHTRLHTRTRDLKLDRLTTHFRKLNIALHLFDLMSQRRGSFVSVQIMSRWVSVVGLNVSMGDFLKDHSHVFEVFTHPVKRNLCCKVQERMLGLIREEEGLIKGAELENVMRVKKLLMISKNGMLHLHALRLVRRDLGLPEDFRDSVLGKYSDDFKLVDLEVVSLVRREEDLGVAEVEKWRDREYKEKWLSEFETKYAFPIDLPTGFVVEKGFRGKLKDWQRMPYVKPYEKEGKRSRTSAGIERFEKRVVGIIHEFLSLTMEKKMEVERFAHFRKDLGIEVNLRELLLKHPGIFYISTKGNAQTIFLREAYSKGCLIDPNPIYIVRRKMVDLMLLGRRNTKELKPERVGDQDRADIVINTDTDATKDGEWIIPLLESSDD